MDTLLAYILTIVGSVPDYAQKLTLAAIAGLLIGFERELRGKPASLRTFSAICVGSCLFTILSSNGLQSDSPLFDPSRIAAQIVSGVGFLGAGVIFKTTNRIEGITTAALIWLAAALGMAAGFGKPMMVVWALILGAGINILIWCIYKIIFAYRKSVAAEGEVVEPPVDG